MSTQALWKIPGNLHHAIDQNLGLEKIWELVRHDPSLLHQKDPKNNHVTPLHWACSGDDDSLDPLAFLLIKQGADVNSEMDPYNLNLQTPLLLACFNNRKALVKRLLEAGADINYKNAEGKTAFTIEPEFAPILQQIIDEVEEVKMDKERRRIERVMKNRFMQIETQIQATMKEIEELKSENEKLKNDLNFEREERILEVNKLKKENREKEKLINNLSLELEKRNQHKLEQLENITDNRISSALEAATGPYSDLTIMQCVTLLKTQLGITVDSSSPKLIVDAALELLSDDEVNAYCDKCSSLVLKAQYLVEQVMG